MTKHQDEFGVFIRCTRLSVYFEYSLYSFIRLFRVSVVL